MHTKAVATAEMLVRRWHQTLLQLIEECELTVDATLVRLEQKSATKLIQDYETGKRDVTGCLCCCSELAPDIGHSPTYPAPWGEANSLCTTS